MMKRQVIVDRLFPATVTLTALLSAGDALAQATGNVAVATGPTSSGQSLESLQQLLLSPPEPALNLFLTPQYTYESFDGWKENGTLSNPQGQGPQRVEDLVIQPDFSISTPQITGGADYLFGNGLLLGASLSYSHADYDFETRSREEFADDALTDPSDIGNFALGEPLDREFDQYGGTLAVGYLKDPWTILLTGALAYRDNIDTQRSEFNGNQVDPDLATVQEIVYTKGNTDSTLYSVELGASYRFVFDKLSIQPLASIGYQREHVDGYTEDFDSAFQRPVPSKFQPAEQFVQVPESRVSNPNGTSRSTVRQFNSQNIESIPLEVGALFTAQIGDQQADYALSNLAFGATYTHDFDDQQRKVDGESLNFQGFSVEYDEKNRNQDYVSLTGAADFRLAMVRGTLTFQQDVGFDQRDWASSVRLQLRVPVSLGF